MPGERNCKAAPLIDFAGDRDATAVKLSHTVDEDEAKPCTAKMVCIRDVELDEWLEEFLDILLGQADACIPDSEVYGVIFGIASTLQTNFATLWRKLDGVT